MAFYVLLTSLSSTIQWINEHWFCAGFFLKLYRPINRLIEVFNDCVSVSDFWLYIWYFQLMFGTFCNHVTMNIGIFKFSLSIWMENMLVKTIYFDNNSIDNIRWPHAPYILSEYGDYWQKPAFLFFKFKIRRWSRFEHN